MGAPEFAVVALDALVQAGHDIACVYTQPPRPAGRGQRNRPTPVHRRAGALGLPVRHPVSLKAPQVQAEFAAIGAEAAVVVAYGLILPPPVLEAPARGCLNIHASLLPRWRGAAPIHRAIMAGDRVTGVSIMRMDAGLDTGPVLLRREAGIGAEETTGELGDRLAVLGGEAIVEALALPGAAEGQPQSGAGVTYAGKIAKAEARIDWAQPADVVDRQIRGLSPFPGAWCEYDGQRIRLLACLRPDDSIGGPPGQVLDDRLTVACGSGAVRLLRLQRAGKGAQDAGAFLRGFPVPGGAWLR